MYTVQDYGLTQDQLEDKYSKYDFHFHYRRAHWEQSGTDMPYWAWVHSKIELERQIYYRNIGRISDA